MSTEALKRAVKIAGSQEKLARILGGKIKQQHISWWLNESKRVPAEYVLAIEAATGVSRYDLRPDIYPPTLATEAISSPQ